MAAAPRGAGVSRGRTRQARRVALAFVLALGVASRASGEPPALREQVQLLGAADNARLERDLPSGTATLGLTLRVSLPATPPRTGELAVTEFAAEGRPPHVVRPVLGRLDAAPPAADGRRLRVPLAPGWVEVEVGLADLRPGTVYKGKLYLFSEGASHVWDLTVRTSDLGILAVDRLPPIQLVTYHPKALVAWLAGGPERWRTDTLTFPITLRDKSDQGPYPRVRARLEEVTRARTATIGSNFTLDALSFWTVGATGLRRLDLAAGGAASPAPAGAGTLTVERGAQVTIWARAQSLSPGAYAGVLRFGAERASAEAEEAKLALTVQVRHHWVLPVLVTVLGALVGWFGKKYVEGHRTARRLREEARALAEAADFLARPDLPRGGWQFPGEGTSYALARVRVIVHQVRRLAGSALRVLAVEQEMNGRLTDARRRLTALEGFRATRLRVQAVADHLPAAQTAIGRALRRGLEILDRPAFGDPQKDEVIAILRDAEAWLAPEAREARYHEAIADGLRALPPPAVLAELAGTPVGDRIQALRAELPRPEAAAQRPLAQLIEDDRRAARLALLWREHETPWIDRLLAAETAGEPLETLYRRLDEVVWSAMTDHRAQFRLVRAPGRERVATWDLVEFRLRVHADGITEARVSRHPCLVRWRVEPAEGPPRTVETDGLTLVQYFPTPGLVAVRASLVWGGQTIDVPEALALAVEENKEFRPVAALDEWIEYGVTALAALFSVLTALQALYDATFGSFTQYITLFLWAAGASVGGNLFKQLGAGRTVGGREMAPPAR